MRGVVRHPFFYWGNTFANKHLVHACSSSTRSTTSTQELVPLVPEVPVKVKIFLARFVLHLSSFLYNKVDTFANKQLHDTVQKKTL